MAYFVVKCPKCKKENFPEAKSCIHCEASLMNVSITKINPKTGEKEVIKRHRTPRRCPECGWGNPGSYLLCGKCGHEFVKQPKTTKTKATKKTATQDLNEPTALSQAIARQPTIKRRYIRRAFAFLLKHWVWTAIAIWILWTPVINQYLLAVNSGSRAGEVADIIGMSDKAKIIFFKSVPQELPKDSFQSACPGSSTQQELGCYYKSKIYYLQLTAAGYSEGVYVTAAHEMLHAAYQKMDSEERQRIAELVWADFKRLNNPELNAIVEEYRKSGDTDVRLINELHSFLGTEYRGLSLELEKHYSQYFDSRESVVVLSDTDKANRKSKIDSFVNDQNNLNARVADLNNFTNRMNYWAYNNAYAYNNNRANYDTTYAAVVAEKERVEKEFKELEAAETERDSTKLPSFNVGGIAK